MDELPASLHETLAGRYVIEREAGRGGAATVYLARDIRHERRVAIKVLHAELSHTLGAQRFLREIRLTAGLQHPHILPIHDSGQVGDRLYYVMPYVEGDSLRQRLAADARLSVEEAVRIGREVAGAIAYAHERGIVHRDIKPENILFSGGHAVLADFGIARAIDRASGKLTQQGTITGTPAYMSPEQARDREFDGRSDIYSLACVLYEAIAGVPPYVGDTPQAILRQRVSRPAPLLREYRHDVPAPIEAVVARGLSLSPDDRYADARAFSAALSAAIGTSGETATVRPERRRAASAWRWAAGVALLATGVVAASPGARTRLGVFGPRVETERYAVMPFAYVGAAAPSAETEPVAYAVYTAMREWSGVSLASDVQVLDAVRHGDDRSLAGMQAAARTVHAGRLVWGRVWVERDSLRVRVALYDALDGTSLRELTVAGPRAQLTARAGGMRGAVAELLRAGGGAPVEPDVDAGTRSLAAWRAYERARRALDVWHVDEAIVALRDAVAADPAFPRARVWLAQLLLWRDAPAREWQPHVGFALHGRATLPPREAALAEALESIEHGRVHESCASYARLRDRDSLDAAAWLGLAYCEASDRAVVRSPGSPTGRAFAGSAGAGQRAYARAVRLAPAAFGAMPFDAVTSRLFIIESYRLRTGRASDGGLYHALPGLAGDTLAFVAHSPVEMWSLPLPALAPRYYEALERNREMLLELLATVTRERPGDADAFEALARVLEARHEITGTPNGGYSALGALERARSLATDSIQRTRLGASDVRLRLKLGDFGRAASLADSILAATPRADGLRAALLAGLAAFLGREGEAVRYLRASGLSVAVSGQPLPPAVEDVSAALFVRTALGACDDSVRTLRRRLDVALTSYVEPDRVPAVRDDLLQRPLLFAAGCLGFAPTLAVRRSDMGIFRVAQALGRGEPASARQRLDSLQRARGALRPGDQSLDFMVAEARARAALGDTAAAIRQLDLTLTALTSLQPHVVKETGMAAAVGVGMAYRAELAARRGDRGTAALWAGRVLTIWRRADPSLAPTLARMRRLAGEAG